MSSKKNTNSAMKSRSASSTKNAKKPQPTARSQQITVPAAFGEIIRPKFNVKPGVKKYPGSMVVEGTDLISTISITNATGVPVTYPIATLLFNEEISPLSEILSGSRINRIGQTFDKYCFRKMRFHYSSTCSTSTNGSIILAYDTDPVDDTPPATIHGFQAYMALRDSIQMNVWKSNSLICRLSSPDDVFYTTSNSPEERQFFQGQVYLATASTITVPANSTVALGNLFFDYDVLFFDPSIETSTMIYGTTLSGAIPLGTTTTAQVRQNLLTDGVRSFVDSSGRYVLDYSDTVGGPRIQLQNAGQYMFSSNGSATYAYSYGGAQSSNSKGYARIQLETGPGITAAPAAAENTGGEVQHSVIADGAEQVNTTFGSLYQLLVDPKSSVLDRWVRPVLLSARGSAWVSPDQTWVANALWWLLQRTPTQLAGLGGPFSPPSLMDHESTPLSARDLFDLRRSRPGSAQSSEFQGSLKV